MHDALARSPSITLLRRNTLVPFFTMRQESVEGLRLPKGPFSEIQAFVCYLTIAAFTGLSFISPQAAAQHQVEPGILRWTPAAVPTSGVPEYQFKNGGYITDWLLLEPVMRGQEFDNPKIKDLAPTTGGEVVFPGGEKRHWRRFAADSQGVVTIATFCREYLEREFPQKPFAACAVDRVVYAYCELVCPVAQQRQLMIGLDDGGRAWLGEEEIFDDVRRDWMALFEHRTWIDFTDSRRKGLLLELHNWGGEFKFACYVGHTVNGRVVYADGTTPVAGEIITAEIDGEAPKAFSTDITGQFTISGVPYDQPVTLHCQGATVHYPPNALLPQGPTKSPNDLLLRVTPPIHPVVQHKLLHTTKMVYTAVAENSDGLLLLGNDRTKSIDCYNGRSTFPFPTPLLQDFTTGKIAKIHVSIEGDIWIATEGDGLFRYRRGALKHWPAEETFEEPRLLEEMQNGDVIAHFRADLDGQRRCQWGRIALGSDEFVIEHVGGFEALVFAFELEVDQGTGSESWFYEWNTDKEIAIHTPNGVRLTMPPAGAMIECGAAGEDGTAWFAGRSLFSLSPAGVWTEYPTSADSSWEYGQFVAIGPAGEVWCGGESGVCLLRNGTLQRFPIASNGEETFTACATRAGSLIVVGGEGKVYEFRPTQHREFDFRDGFRGMYGSTLTRSPSGIIVSQNALNPVLISGDSVEPIDISGLVTEKPGKSERVVFRSSPALATMDDGTMLAFAGLQQNSGLKTTTNNRPFIQRPNGTWDELDCSVWVELMDRFNFCTQLPNGRVIIGSWQGLAEIIDGQAVPCNILEGFPGKLPEIVAIDQDSAGTIWAVTANGQLARSSDGQVDVFEFPARDALGRVALCEFANRVWLGTKHGLFYFDQSRNAIRQFSNKNTTLLDVIGLLKRPGSEHMWVVTNGAGVFSMQDDFSLMEVSVFPDSETRAINSCVVSPDGRLWLCTDSGTIAYQPTLIAPVLTIDEPRVAQLESKDLRPRQIECDRPFSIPLAWQDDSARLNVRYRINYGKWISNEFWDPHELNLDFNSSGAKTVEIQAYDGDWNYSQVKTLKFSAYYPPVRNPWVQAAVAFLVLVLVVALAVLWRSIIRTRRERDRILQNLLAEESKAREVAEEASSEREMLLARVCHDLRNPLGVVVLVKDMLRIPKTDRSTLVELLDGSLQSMQYMVEQLLTYAKSRAQCGTTPEPSSMSIASFLDRFRLAADLRLENTKVEFRIVHDPDFQRNIWMDENVLTEILNNLFENAVKHTLSGHITLACEINAPNHICFVLTDTGLGMSEEVQEAIFQPFFKGASDPQDGLHSVGLGMFIVNELVARADGTITIDSKLGVGTRIALTFPLRLSPIPHPHLPLGPPIKRHGQGTMAGPRRDLINSN